MLQSRRLRVFAESTAGGQKATVCCWTADDAANETARFGGDACEDASCLFLGYREGEIMLSVHDFDLLATKNKSYYADASTLCKLTGIVCDEEQSFAKLHRSVFMCAHLEKLIKCQLVSPHEVRFDVTFNFPYGALRGKLQKYFSSEDKGHFLLKEKFRNSAAVVCRACGDRVLELRGNDGPARFTGFLLMPHDDWRELVDCWSCHKDEFGHLAFKPYVYQPRKVYVGLDYFVFGADLLVSTASAAFGRCKCGKVAENVPINALNLLWVCADAGSCADEPVVYSHLSGSLLLMLKIVAMSRDNSSFRFVLINGDRTKFLLVNFLFLLFNFAC